MLYRTIMSFALIICLSSCASTDRLDLAGDWAGTLNIGGGSLRLIFHITESEDGFSTVIESVDQGGVMIPTELLIDGDTLVFLVESLGVDYAATLSGNQITGTFKQSGMTVENYTITRSD